ncbi:hypothetical protein SAY86_007674 [Trapa natans]|uniref:ENTH domain-containing protein n=1 Tax=Trapa natans TaxID=22666 RepID=A0AAN7LDV8_TRANT|nr:hypothetical protein SAY86_007674 [Trapa natans]
MSMLLRQNMDNSIMGSSFNEFKRQASFFLRDKIKTARLKLTDVTPAQLLTEEVTNGNPWSPDTRTMAMISRAAFEVDDFWRIVEILHKRLVQFDRKNWRASYNALILLEHLLTHGPQSAVDEFRDDKGVIEQMKEFHLTDQKGFNWGLCVQKLSERVLNLLEDRQFWQEQRERAREVTRGIQGFGSFCQWPCSSDGRWRSRVYKQEEGLLVSDMEVMSREGDKISEPERRQGEVKCLAVMEEDHHPFCGNEHLTTESLLSKKLK